MKTAKASNEQLVDFDKRSNSSLGRSRKLSKISRLEMILKLANRDSRLHAAEKRVEELKAHLEFGDGFVVSPSDLSAMLAILRGEKS